MVGTTTRYIAGRQALQTVYWRKSAEAGKGMVKTTRTFNFNKTDGRQVNSGEMFAKIRDRYN